MKIYCLVTSNSFYSTFLIHYHSYETAVFTDDIPLCHFI